jgi:hypothetical protein
VSFSGFLVEATVSAKSDTRTRQNGRPSGIGFFVVSAVIALYFNVFVGALSDADAARDWLVNLK